MQQVMLWLGIAYTVLSAVAGLFAILARAAPKVPFFATAASACGTLALDLHKLLPGGEEPIKP